MFILIMKNQDIVRQFWINNRNELIAGSFTVSLSIDLRFPSDLGNILAVLGQLAGQWANLFYQWINSCASMWTSKYMF